MGDCVGLGRIFLRVTDYIFAPTRQVPLVNSSADYYSTGPLISCLRRGWRIVVIVKAARLHGHEIERLPALSVVQYADGIDLRAIGVFRVWIRCHVVSSRVLVHEQHARPDRNGEFLRAHTARGQRKGVGIGWRRRRSRGAVAPATARGDEQAQKQDEDCHCR